MKINQPTYLILILCVVLLYACKEEKTVQYQPTKNILDYVDPMIGTGGHGHTYPGATMPFGMVQLSPDTRLTGWDGCSGYHFSDDTIYGFTHTHLSGTGVSDYGDILLMPINNAKELVVKDLTYEQYLSSFSHDKEKASPGYYEVYLDQPKVKVELTTTLRTGLHRYTFDQAQSPGVVLDLEHRDPLHSANYQQVDEYTIEGHRHSYAWAENQQLYFVIQFSSPITSMSKNKDGLKTVISFSDDSKVIEAKVAISAVDLLGARRNLDAEAQAISFDEAKQSASTVWEKELNKIQAVSLNEEHQRVFYTSLYHTMIAPNIYNDVDGRYRSTDQKIYTAKDHNHYTVFSLWDTYRTLHPLHTIINRDRSNDWVQTMLDKYEKGGIMPIWDLSACYTGCMIGYHGVSVIADAHIKGIRDYDSDLALRAMMHSANQTHLGLEDYQDKGFISVEKEAESVSKTLEYAYDDWCIAQMARELGKEEVYQRYMQRSMSYRNLFDPETKFFRPRIRNFWLDPFDPFEVNSNYTEANAWHYAFAPVHDIAGFAALHGGVDSLAGFIDELFLATSKTSGRHQVDITGLIGQYAHGNEPSHHIAYLYNYLGQAWKAQQTVREILHTQYSDQPDGISGNEDCGQMGAWYVMSAMGLYPVAPGSPNYVIGSPNVQSASIQLENKNVFKIAVQNNSEKNVFIQSLSLNGKSINRPYISHDEIMAGGTLTFVMTDQPNKKWGQDTQQLMKPIEVDLPVPVPYFENGDISFTESTKVSIASVDDEVDIYYTLDEKEYHKYEQPIALDETSTICTYGQTATQRSAIYCTEFVKRDASLSITLNSEFVPMYNGGGDDALIDALRGGKDFRTGNWQGYQGQHLELVVDLGASRQINSLKCGFLQDENSWIFMPRKVEYWTSQDGVNYKKYGTVTTQLSADAKGTFIEDFESQGKVDAKYVKMKATSFIHCPKWHKGSEHNGQSWLFADEIQIR